MLTILALLGLAHKWVLKKRTASGAMTTIKFTCSRWARGQDIEKIVACVADLAGKGWKIIRQPDAWAVPQPLTPK